MQNLDIAEIGTCIESGVWLPIALTCRICHDTQYQDTNRILQYHYILAITLTP
jgi:hypothetical protein